MSAQNVAGAFAGCFSRPVLSSKALDFIRLITVLQVLQTPTARQQKVMGLPLPASRRVLERASLLRRGPARVTRRRAKVRCLWLLALRRRRRRSRAAEVVVGLGRFFTFVRGVYGRVCAGYDAAEAN